jgi:YVTN family beta-propeller protein
MQSLDDGTDVTQPSRAAVHSLSRRQRLSITCATAITIVAATAVACSGHGGGNPTAASAPPGAATSSTSPSASPSAKPSPRPAAETDRVRDSNAPEAPLPGMPPIASATNIYADAGANMLTATTRKMPYRIYVPNSEGSSLDVINPNTMHVVALYPTGLNPQHVVPAYDMKTLYVTNDQGNSLTPVNPMTARPDGPNIPVADPYNMYFTPDGKYAMVVAEAEQHLDFRNPKTFALEHETVVNCPGVDHVDFSANGGYMIATCEFSGKLVKVNMHTLKVVQYLQLPSGSSPQDIKLAPGGRIFYVADRYKNGVWLLNGEKMKTIGFIPTGADAHGIYPSRDAKDMYVTNRVSGTVSVIDVATRKVVDTWSIPGGSPDMGGISPDGKVLWLAGRYNSEVYALSTTDGHLLARIAVGLQPHGLCVWPQPGRFSLGHTGVTR